MDIDVDKLICEVYSRPGLWDKNDKNHHNRVIVSKLWQSIENEINIPAKHLRKKWKYLRDQFRCECRKIPPSALKQEDDELELTSMWPHFKPLLFLKPQIKFRKKSSNISSVEFEKEATTTTTVTATAIHAAESDSDIETDINNSTENCTTNDFQLLECQPLTEPRSGQPQKRYNSKNKNLKRSNIERIVEIEKQKLELLERKVQTRNIRDEDEAFFESMLPHIRTLKPAQKILCRIELQEVLYKHVYRESSTKQE